MTLHNTRNFSKQSLEYTKSYTSLNRVPVQESTRGVMSIMCMCKLRSTAGLTVLNNRLCRRGHPEEVRRDQSPALVIGVGQKKGITVFMSGDIQEKVRRDHSPALASGLMLDSASNSTSSPVTGYASRKYRIYMIFSIMRNS